MMSEKQETEAQFQEDEAVKTAENNGIECYGIIDGYRGLIKKDFELMKRVKKDIERIIRSCGSYTKKSSYILEIARSLVDNYNGVVPNDRDYLESLPGVGRKTVSVFLSEFYDIPAIFA